MGEDQKPQARATGTPDDAQHLRRLFKLSLDLMCVAGVDGYFKRVNPAFEHLLGYDREHLLSRQFIEFVHPDDRQSTLEEVENLAHGSIVVDFANRYRTSDGDYRWLAWRAAPIVESGLIYAVARDITEQKHDQKLLARQAEELARSNADLEQFAYVASHDLRAPLRSIVNLTQFIEDDLGEAIPDKTREHLDELRRRALLMKALTDDLLAYSQAGRELEEVATVDTAALVRELAFLLDPPEGFEIVPGEGLPVLETARAPLEQVLRNLVANAVKHHDRAEGRVCVSARESGRFWEFAVEDDGPGIAERDRARIFQAFRQGDAHQRFEGRGMGLALVQRIVDGAGGEVSLDRTDGRGATFRFSWPKQIGDEPQTA